MSDTTREPVAWTVEERDGRIEICHTTDSQDVAKAWSGLTILAERGAKVISLYRDPPPPTLSDAEREAVWSAIEHGEDATVSGLPPLWTSALRQLLARLGGER